MSVLNIMGDLAGRLRNWKFRHQAISISANWTIAVNTAPLLFITPDAARDVTLPAVADSEGLAFIIVNTAASGYTLTIKNVGGTTIVSIAQNAIGIVACNGSAWKGFSYVAPSGSVQEADIANGVITNSKLADNAVGPSKIATASLTGLHAAAATSGSSNGDGNIDIVHNLIIASGTVSAHLTFNAAEHLLDAHIRGLSYLAASTIVNILVNGSIVGIIGANTDAATVAGGIKRATSLTSSNATAGQTLKAVLSGTATCYGIGVTVCTVRGSLTV